MVRERVDVVLYSQVWTFGSDFDGTGFINAQVSRALASGAIWINAAGNFGGAVYQGAVLGDRRGEMLARLRAVIRAADPDVVEEWKWSVPVWSHDGLICTGEAYKQTVKMTFAKGASVPDPSGLFNSSLDGNTRRAIDFREGDKVNEKALKALIQAAIAVNQAGAKR